MKFGLEVVLLILAHEDMSVETLFVNTLFNCLESLQLGCV